jgi:autotransporter-associated beta strand protein
MPLLKTLNPRATRHWIPALAISWLALAAPVGLRASTFQAGDVTSNLGPTFFVDDASNGGSDTDFSHNATLSFTRLFHGQLAPNQGPTRVILSGFGFATHTSDTANDATSIEVTFTYLGADGVVGGGDDVAIGTATGSFTFVPSASNPNAEYYFAFPTPLTADLNITATRFRIQVKPTNANHITMPDTVLKLKSGPLASEPSVTSAKLSVAGVAKPLPLINPQRLNLAKFQPVTATSVAGQRLATYLTDGVVGNDNRWQGSSSTWQSAVIDFPFPVEVGSAQVFTGVDDTNPIASYGVQFWNGTAWTSIDGASVSGNTNTERNLVFTNPVTASSFRFISSEANLRVKELALYPPNGPSGYPLGTDLTLNLAYQRPTVASATTAGNFALQAVDGRAQSNSMWQTTTAGTNTLDIDLRVSTKIGSAHIYSGSPGVLPLADFMLKSWDGTTWQDIPGGAVTGNTTADLVDSFTPVTTSRVRLEFTNPGTTSIREISIFPANAGNAGYPIGSNLIDSGAIANYETYNDSFHLIENTTSGRRISVPNNGQPALDPAGLTFGQSQYQVLLNLSNGTYRLRNRASGNCLSGAQFDKTPGLLLTDAPYTALPHQDWILDALGGGSFQFINPWSGLAIDSQGEDSAQGTPLVQNTATGSATQRWKIIKHLGAPKKGIGGTTFAQGTNPNWAYNWGRSLNNPMPADASFFPMQWGNFSWDIGSAQGPLWQEYPRWRTRADGVHLMGFNEPDRTDQSNMTMEQVISLWPRLQEMDLPLVGPAPGTASWLTDFYTQSDALGYRVDYTAIHAYPGPSATNLINSINNAATYNGKTRPVWLTEFSFVDWGKNQSWSEENTYNELAEFLWRAESNANLRKYALFVFTENDEWPQPANSWSAVSPAPRSNSYDRNGNLTAFGKLYQNWDGDTTIQTNKAYMVHNRGLRKRMANAATSNTAPGGRTIRTDGRIVNWNLVPTGISNRYYMVSVIDGRRMSYVTASNPNNDPALVAAGTTGASVEWSLTHNEHGWHYIGHPQTNTRLRLVSYATDTFVADYRMVTADDADQNQQWRFIVAAPQTSWSGAGDNSWATAGNWTSGAVPTSEDVANFDISTSINRNTVLNQDTSVLGLRVINPGAAVTIGGANSLTIGAYGIDLSAATRDLTINTPVILDARHGWMVNNNVISNVIQNRTLNLGGVVTGNHDLTIGGSGKVSLSASNVLPTGPGSNNLIVNGSLDLNGTSQSINGLTGTGIIDNTAVGSASLTLGNNNAASTLSSVQNSGGALALIKTGSGSVTFSNANTFSGGLTNNGTGAVIPQNNAAFGTGPVVMNAATLYATAADYTIANPLTLNGAILRVGGGNNRTLAWSGPVSASGASSINADGSTTGVILTGGLEITGGTFSSNNGGVSNTIGSPITGTSGTLRVSSGTLNLTAANTFSGTIRSASGSLIIGHALAIQNATLDMNSADNGSVDLNNLDATLGALTGSRNLALGNAAITIGNNGTSTTYSGIMSGNGSLAKTGSGTLTLAAANSYSGPTAVNGGTLAITAATLATNAITFTANSALGLVIGSPVTASNAAVNFTNGTVAVSGSPGAPSHVLLTAFSFTGTPVLASPVPGYTLAVVGNELQLNQATTNPYDLWKTQITNGQDGRAQDADDDGFNNLQEFLFGTSPIVGNGSLVTATASANNLVLQWLQRETAATYTLKQGTSLATGSWISVLSPIPAPDPDQSGVPANYDRHKVTLPTIHEKMFFRIEGVEN